jgi:hypothetical protein
MKKILQRFWRSINHKKDSAPISKVPSHLKFRYVNVSVISNKTIRNKNTTTKMKK